ncbi:PQQ-binding-like beta-propeller repeat protein [candidate division KSB1 bacterium]|nr:PQQ-binding-like beta-propeller repeat protein [candidate division KSB1 bacterium]
MNKRYFKLFIISFSLLISQYNCQRIILKPNKEKTVSAIDWPISGGNPARSGIPEARLEFPLELAWTFKPNSAVEPALILQNEMLYFGCKDKYIFVLNSVDGKKVGRFKMRFSSTCAVQEHFLVLASRYGKNTLFAYDLSHGKYLWEVDAGDIPTEPLIVDQSIYIAALYQHVDRYELKTGKKVWTFKTKSQLHSSPAQKEGILVVGSDDGIVYALKVENGFEKWTYQTAGTIYATPVIHDSIVYIGSFDNYLYALNLKNGTLNWKFQTKAKITQAVAVTDDFLWVGSNDYCLYCLNRLDGSLVWKFQAQSIITTTPVVARQVVIVGSADKHYYALDIKTGNPVWQYETKGRIRTTPVISNGYLFGASENNFVYAFGSKKL